MILGKVVGTVVSTQKDSKLEGLKFFLVEKLDMRANPTGAFVVCADTVGSGLGEVILFASGSSARYTDRTTGKPTDASVMAIVDTLEIGGEVVYQKSEQP